MAQVAFITSADPFQTASKANLNGVTLTYAIFENTDISDISLMGVDLSQVDLRCAVLR